MLQLIKKTCYIVKLIKKTMLYGATNLKNPCYMVRLFINTLLYNTSDYKHHIIWCE